MSDKADVWQDTLALMIVKTLEALGPPHGYGSARRAARLTIRETLADVILPTQIGVSSSMDN